MDRAAAPAVVPFAPTPFATLATTFVVPRPGAWQLVSEVYEADAPCPPATSFVSPTGFRVRYRLRNLDTGETVDPLVTPASADRHAAGPVH